MNKLDLKKRDISPKFILAAVKWSGWEAVLAFARADTSEHQEAAE